MEKAFFFEPRQEFAALAAEMAKAPAAVKPAIWARAEELERCANVAAAGCFLVAAIDAKGPFNAERLALAVVKIAMQMAWIKLLQFEPQLA